MPAATQSLKKRSIPRTNRHNLRNWLILIGLTSFFLILDQVTKVLVRQNLAIGEQWAPIPALSKIFTFTRVQNTGVAFGQLQGLGWLFMVVNLVVLVGVIVYYPRIPAGQWPLRLASALILVGDLGNVIDRLRTTAFGAQQTGSFWTALPLANVTDFLDFKVWPVFNVADLCVVSGVAIVAYTMWRTEKAQVPREPAAGDQ